MTNTQKFLAWFFILTGLTGGAAFLYMAIERVPAAPAHATALPHPLPLPEFELTADDGGRFDRNALRGRNSLLFFGFTHCPDICPATLSQLALARARLADDFDETSLPDIVLISVDPFRDTPETLTAYVSKFGPGVRGATGDLGELKKLAGAGGIYFAVSPQENGSYSVDHSAAVLVINKNAELHAVFGAPHSVDHFAADLPLLLEST